MFELQTAFQLILAALLGGAVGFEREFWGKAAGFRTHALVAVSSCLLMRVSIYVFEIHRGIADVDPSRIAAQVVTGIGFIGAGAIIRSGVTVKGITTAASLWAVAAIGLASGAGYYPGAFYATAVVMIVLLAFAKLEDRVLKKAKK